MFDAKLLDDDRTSRMTPGQRYRFRRNLVIYTSWKSGFSQRYLADVFLLPRSRIAAIVKEIRQYDPEVNGEV